MLIGFVTLYLIFTVSIGLWAARRVRSSTDYALAARSLPLAMIVTTTFATWFGSETVLGISSKFMEEGLGNVVEDPFGASMCLVLVGMFFARRLYRMKLLTISDFYRKRFGSGIEVFFVAAGLTMMLGSIPQQDVFQRVMSAQDDKTAQRGPIIGGLAYLAFAFVPMFIVACAVIIMPEETKALIAGDPQKVLPTLIMSHMPLVAQIFFFGAPGRYLQQR